MLASLLAAAVLGAPAQNAPMPRAELVKKLESVPAFIIMSPSGQPLTATLQNHQKLLSAYTGLEDAQHYLQAIKEKSPAIANQVKVGAVTIAALFEAVNPEKGLAPYRVEFYASKEEAQAAVTLLKAQGQEVTNFTQAPVFAPMLKDGNYLSSTENGQTIVPLFLSKAEYDTFFAALIKSKPEMKEKVTIEVSTLGKVIELLKTEPASKTRPLTIIPSKKSIEAAKRINN